MDDQQTEAARRAVDAGIEKFPSLSTYGVSDRLILGERDQMGLYARQSLMTVCLATDWFRSQLSDPRRFWIEKSVRHKLNSFLYRSAIEGRYGRYVSNGAVIAAAAGLGLRMYLDSGYSNPVIQLIADVPEVLTAS